MDIRELTKAEEEVMQKLWTLEKAFVKDIIRELPEPKPAYNTVSTIIRILENKGFVGHESFGKSHQYYPLIDRDTYKSFATKKLVSSYFDDSAQNMLSFFLDNKQIDTKELDEIMKILEQAKKK
ncbi:BlaI/MecI/CopY family transcriptional regulator [Albibacterium indicum]|uniref:BlaI/MecI/CopY family transcriptional regulator n=1 Tax=Albibacterium indicum TaxID=2292082 RepID=UPI000E4C875E|nr:BlaI/MecI/CopY family transcriptional regulator [Pedobacter indicus]